MTAASDVIHGRFARLLTAAAFLRANSAVLVLARVALAFFRARAACERADFECGLQHRLVRARAPRGQRARRDAEVGAIHVEPDALPKVLHHFLRKTRICAADARLRARETLLDTPHERLTDVAANIRMSADHLLSLHCGLLDRSCGEQRSRGMDVPAQLTGHVSVC